MWEISDKKLIAHYFKLSVVNSHTCDIVILFKGSPY